MEIELLERRRVALKTAATIMLNHIAAAADIWAVPLESSSTLAFPNWLRSAVTVAANLGPVVAAVVSDATEEKFPAAYVTSLAA